MREKKSKTTVLGDTLIFAVCRSSAGKEDATMRPEKPLFLKKQNKKEKPISNEMPEQVEGEKVTPSI